MNMLRYLAHAGESHQDALESTRHAVEIDPLVASLMIVAVCILIPYVLLKTTKSQSLAMVAGLAEMLLVGILTYSALPILSAIALVTGFTLTLILVFYSM